MASQRIAPDAGEDPMIKPDHHDAAASADSATTGGTAAGPRLRAVVTLDSAKGGWQLLAPGGSPQVGRCDIPFHIEPS